MIFSSEGNKIPVKRVLSPRISPKKDDVHTAARGSLHRPFFRHDFTAGTHKVEYGADKVEGEAQKVDFSLRNLSTKVWFIDCAAPVQVFLKGASVFCGRE